ncbi:MAG: D-aminoacyl-tRNA deacylase [Kiritimatiellae bacterium]|nr:D-aminoacyl-tRNA deacylase [Kiritimatiellia bacterium]
MKALIQRVQRGSVSVEGRTIGAIGRGYVVFLGVKQGDSAADADYLAGKTAALRIFPDDQLRMNLSISDVGGSILVISQFTLHADTRKGNRPSFILAAPAEQANALYEAYVAGLRRILGAERVVTGRFQAMMAVEIMNDGPVTIELKSRNEL